jgi:transcriptional regulator with XRE-family HTH domain
MDLKMKNSLSLFLKAIRHHNNKEKLSDMAIKLNVSSSYLSTVENGKRAMNDKLYDSIVKTYNLTLNESQELDLLRKLEVNRLNVSTQAMDTEKKETLIKFLSNLNDLNDDDLEKINNLINKKNK